jgi:histidine triad (HIT) family protein
VSDDPTVFEKIIAGELPARVVHETETTMAFLDANPLAPGHTLVVSKEPYERLRDAPPEIAADVFAVVRELAPVVEDAVGAAGTTVAVNDGAAAGQEVPHLHVHVVPRSSGDGGGPVHAAFQGPVDLPEERLDEIAAAITDRT